MSQFPLVCEAYATDLPSGESVGNSSRPERLVSCEKLAVSADSAGGRRGAPHQTFHPAAASTTTPAAIGTAIHFLCSRSTAEAAAVELLPCQEAGPLRSRALSADGLPSSIRRTVTRSVCISAAVW